MNIYRHEFKSILRSVIGWSIAIVVLLLVFMSIFPVFSKDAALLNEALSQMPPELLMAFGLTGIDMTAVLGYFSFVFLFCQICLAIQAANYGFGLVSVEERDMTADFLLAKPVSRPRILTSKLLAAITGLLLTDVVVWIASFLVINAFSGGQTYDSRTFVLLMLSLIVFQLFFLSVGTVVSLLVKRIRSVISAAMALAFGMYVLSTFGSMLGGDTLDIITPFKHFDPNYIVANGAYNMPLVLLSVIIIVVAIAGSYLLYGKRNIHTAI